MKKHLLFLLAISFLVAVGYTQVPQLKQQAMFNSTVMKTGMAKPESEPFFAGNDPIVSAERGQDVVIGETWYDLQSNSTMMNRLYTYPDGTMAVQ